MIESRAFCKRLMCILICGSVLVWSGCRFPWQPLNGEQGMPPSPQMIRLYHQAVTAYQAEAYVTAAKRFLTVQENVPESELGRSALFGLACSKLMLAETPRQYQRAVALWDSWVKNASKNFDNENPLLLAPVVRNKMIFSKIPLTAEGKGDIEASPMVSQWLVINAAKEIKRLEAKIESSQQINRKLKENDILLRKEITKLKQKIKALETIDQKIQKKKSAIPSTESTAPR